MKTFKDIAIAAAKVSGKMLLQVSQDEIKYQMKNPHDILAEADIASEKLIISHIKETFSNHSIFSEEQGEEIHDKEYLWIIDPIDGTINFSRRIEDFAISIALSHRGEIILGVIYQPVTDKLYVAEKGKGAYLNDKKITTSKETNLINTLVATDNTSKIDKRLQNFTLLTKISPAIRHARIFGSCSLHLAKIAEGQLDFYFKISPNFWDFAAGIIILEEAGGKITDFAGNPVIKGSKTILASNGIIHDNAKDLIKNNV